MEPTSSPVQSAPAPMPSFVPAPPPVGPPVIPHQHRTLAAIIFGIIILGLAVTAGALMYTNYFTPDQTIYPVSTPRPTVQAHPTTEVSPSPVLTSWKTYTNATYGYSIQYPPLWTVKVDSPSTQQGGVVVAGAEGSVYVFVNADLGGALCASSGGTLTQIQTAAGSFMGCVRTLAMTSSTGDSSGLRSGTNKYSLAADWNNSSKLEVLQILSSFKFTSAGAAH